MRRSTNDWQRTQVSVLRRLLACERGLSAACLEAARQGPPEGRERALRWLHDHRRHLHILEDRLRARGGVAAPLPDDAWVFGDPADAEMLAVSEQASADALADSLQDLDLESEAVVRREVLPEHVRHAREALSPDVAVTHAGLPEAP